jgi:hypothetical protein
MDDMYGYGNKLERFRDNIIKHYDNVSENPPGEVRLLRAVLPYVATDEERRSVGEMIQMFIDVEVMRQAMKII